MMSYSHPAVHPIDVPPSQANPNANVNVNVNGHVNNNGNLVVNNVPPRVRMKDCQGMPGTLGGLFLRIAQLGFAVAAFSVMLSIEDFSTVTAFCYLVAATVLQCLWSLSLAFIDGYALLVKRSLRNSLIVSLFVVGDGVTGLLTFAAACASAGITVLIENDLRECRNNHCGKYETATAMAFLSWFTVSPSFFLNFWLLASR